MPDPTREFYAELGSRVRAARNAAGLTQTELAGAAGLTRASVANIEAGRQQVLVHHLVAIAAATATDLDALLPGPLSPTVDMERMRRALPDAQGGFVTAVLERARKTSAKG